MKIAVIGDLHYPDLSSRDESIREDRNTFYETFIERFFSVPAKLYVSIGDLTNFGSRSELEEVYTMIRKHDKRFMHVLGNHDLYAMSRHEVLSITSQARSYVISTDHAVLAFIDTAREQDYADWGGTLGSDQLEWLETVIEKSGSRPLIVFAHHPPHETTVRSDQDKRCIHPDVPIWEVLNKKQGVGLYVNGHNHCNSIAEKGQWTFLQIAAVLDDQAVRTIDVTETKITIDRIDVSDPVTKAQAQVIGSSMNHFQLTTDYAGTESDVRRTISAVPVTVAE